MANDQQSIINLIRAIAGQANILTIPRVFIDLTGDLKAALFLSQCIYWSSRSSEPGVFYKTYQDWEKELGMGRYEIDNCRKKVTRWVETELRQVNGAPVLHYSVSFETVANDLTALLNPPKNDSCQTIDSQIHLLETSKSICWKPANPFAGNQQIESVAIKGNLTETTTETTTEINGGVGFASHVDAVTRKSSAPMPPPPSSLQVKKEEEDPSEKYVQNAEALYQRLRPSHLIIPRSRWYEEALRVLNEVLERNGGDMDAAEAELRPYVEESDARGYAPTNLFWLTEWAASGSIPPDRRSRGSDQASQETDPYEGYGSPYKPPTPAQAAKRQALAIRLSKTLGIPLAKAKSMVDEYHPPRIEQCLPLWPLMQRRGMATLETFEAMLYYEGIAVEELRRRFEDGEPLLPEEHDERQAV